MMKRTPKPELFPTLKRGDAVRITFGGSGATQLAIVHKRTPAGNVHAFKYSASRNIWKGPIRIYPTEILEMLDRARELRGIAPLPAEYGA